MPGHSISSSLHSPSVTTETYPPGTGLLPTQAPWHLPARRYKWKAFPVCDNLPCAPSHQMTTARPARPGSCSSQPRPGDQLDLGTHHLKSSRSPQSKCMFMFNADDTAADCHEAPSPYSSSVVCINHIRQSSMQSIQIHQLTQQKFLTASQH